MKVEDIVALVNAGYTKSEISELLSSATSPEPSGPAEAPADPAPVQETVKVEAPAAPAAAPAVDNSEVLSALKELTKTIQRNAILRDDLKLVKPDTAEDILGKIINPTGQK